MKKTTLLLISIVLWTFVSCSDGRNTQIDTTDKNDVEKIITAQFFIKSDRVEDFKTLTTDLISNTRKENGCIFYQLYQSVEDPTAFIFYEIFENQPAFDYHLKTEHYSKFASVINELTSKATELKIIK